MYSSITSYIAFTLLMVVTYSCYTSSTVKHPSIDSQYDIDFNTMSIGDSSFIVNQILSKSNLSNNKGINGRNVTYRDHSLLSELVSSGSGKIYVQTCIDIQGVPAFVQIDKDQTTITDKINLGNALRMVSGYRFDADSTAQEYECGMIKLFLDINAFR